MKNYSLGSPVPTVFRVVGVILQLVGLYALLNIPLQGIFLILLGFIATYQSQGVDVDVVRGKFRFYRSFMGVKSGKWIALSDFPFISIIKRQTSQRVFGMAAAYYEHEKKFYSIILMNASHHIKYVLKNVEGSEKALEEAEQIANELELDLVKFNPPISNRRRGRRR